jgi:hypothetical protein
MLLAAEIVWVAAAEVVPVAASAGPASATPVLRLAARARTRSLFIDTYFFLPSGSRASDEGRSLRPEAGMGQTRIITT